MVHPDDRAARWSAPDPALGEMKGVLGGSQLFEQPQYRAEVQRFMDFIGEPGPVVLEIGFDHGRRLLGLARDTPEQRFVGLEIREQRVLELQAKAPDNLLAWRADARTVLRLIAPRGRFERIDILFPTPWWHGGRRAKRLLLTEAFMPDLARALAPGGAAYVATDVAPYFEHVRSLFAGWTPCAAPTARVPSRRESTCAREGIGVFSGAWRA